MRIAHLCLVLLFMSGTWKVQAQSEEVASFGAANEQAPAALHHVDYMRGEWEVTSYTRDSTGTFQAAEETSFFRGQFLYDGYLMQTEYYGSDPNGFYSTTIITYDTETETFVFSFFNAKLNRRLAFEGHMVDGTMTISNRGGYGQRGDFIYRETDTIISANRFEKRLHRSDDDGRTWQEQNYYFVYDRLR